MVFVVVVAASLENFKNGVRGNHSMNHHTKGGVYEGGYIG